MARLDDETLRRFVRDEYPRVLRTVVASCGDRGRAEDAVQDALLKGWERGVEPDSLAAWVTVVAVNRTRSGLRRLRSERRAYERWARRSPNGSMAAEPDDVELVLAALPSRQRQIVALYYVADLAVVDIADVLKISVGTVKVSLHRARETMRAAIDMAARAEGQQR